MGTSIPGAALVVREAAGQPFYEAKFRYEGRQVKRRIGRAWLTRSGETWAPRRGRVPDEHFDERRAHVAAAQIVADFIEEAEARERMESERESDVLMFREVAHDYLRWLREVRGAKRSSLRDRESVLAEPGTPYRHGVRTLNGYVMAAVGDRPASEITTREIDKLLETVVSGGASASTVNKYRALVVSIFNHGMRESTYGLPGNPALASDRRREPDRPPLVFYSVAEIETLARSLAEGGHRSLAEERHQENPERHPAEVAEDAQDAELVRVAAYAGLRLGELLALRWRDVDFAGHALTISRAMSGGVESSTKSGRVRRVPLPDQAAAALKRLGERADYTAANQLVFCNVLGRTLDGSALRRRFKRARDAAGLRPLRFHDLRHTYGSLLAAGGVDLVTIQAAMGHSALSTTSRYLHARPASEQAAAFTQIFEAKSTKRISKPPRSRKATSRFVEQ
ncbi:MAG TPA: tyrosine-type recombinase/integrase [Solirubrobacteraceae bacterium]|nr:tyrosine-type recombinase/integrase [Solirubrobacteraceae bacterium]